MNTVFTPDFFKSEFANGKSIKQIANEHFISPSKVSKIVCKYEKEGLLLPIDRCSVPPALLTDLSSGQVSFYEAEKITGKSYRYLKRYVSMLK